MEDILHDVDAQGKPNKVHGERPWQAHERAYRRHGRAWTGARAWPNRRARRASLPLSLRQTSDAEGKLVDAEEHYSRQVWGVG